MHELRELQPQSLESHIQRIEISPSGFHAPRALGFGGAQLSNISFDHHRPRLKSYELVHIASCGDFLNSQLDNKALVPSLRKQAMQVLEFRFQLMQIKLRSYQLSPILCDSFLHTCSFYSQLALILKSQYFGRRLADALKDKLTFTG
jgi:hypothetical protein